MDVPLDQAIRLLSPRLTVLVTSLNKEGKANAAPFSWIIPVSFKPPMLALMLQKANQGTLPNIRETREFVVNLVSEDWAQAAVNCARAGKDKLEREGLTPEPSKRVKVPGIKEAKVVLECRLVDILDVPRSDHFIVVGEVVKARGSRNLDEVKPIFHGSGSEFRKLGERIDLEYTKPAHIKTEKK